MKKKSNFGLKYAKVLALAGASVVGGDKFLSPEQFRQKPEQPTAVVKENREIDPRMLRCRYNGMPWAFNHNTELVDEIRGLVKEKGLRVSFGPAYYLDCKNVVPGLTGIYSDTDVGEITNIIFRGFFDFDRENYKERRIYTGSLDDVVEVVQTEMGITHSKDKSPVIATRALGPCVGFVGYNKEHKSGFLIHGDPGTFPISGSLVYQLEKLTPKKQIYEVHLIGGQSKDSKEYVEKVVNSLTKNNLNKNVRFEIVEEDLYGGKDMCRSIALDTRTGEIFDYKGPMKPEDFEERLEALEFGLKWGMKDSPRLAYFPEELKQEEGK